MAYPAPPAENRTNSLTTLQLISLVLLGILFWLVAAMIVRYAGPLGAFEGLWAFVTFGAAVPITVLFIAMMKLATGLPGGRTVFGVSILVCVATLLDGVAITWFTGLYGADPATNLGGAALILWGVGLGLAMAFWMDWRAGVDRLA